MAWTEADELELQERSKRETEEFFRQAGYPDGGIKFCDGLEDIWGLPVDSNKEVNFPDTEEETEYQHS